MVPGAGLIVRLNKEYPKIHRGWPRSSDGSIYLKTSHDTHADWFLKNDMNV